MSGKMLSGKTPIPWPVTLTDKDWQKKKGNVAKLGGETGVGDALEKGKRAYEHVLTAMHELEGKENSAFPQEWKKVAAALEETYKELKAIESAALSTQIKWKKAPLIPAASVKAAKAIETAGDVFTKELKAAAHERVSFMAELGIKA